MDFRWGDKAMVIAAACVYIVSRERERGLPLVDLAVSFDIFASLIHGTLEYTISFQNEPILTPFFS